MLAVYRQHRPDIRLAPDAEQFLGRRDAATGSAVITDGFLDAQKCKIRALGLYGRGIHIGICTDKWGRDCWKPNPRAFEHVEKIFGRAGAALTYVADNPSKDFAAPRALGWNTVQIVRPGRIHAYVRTLVPAHRLIESLEEF
jgi:putative hydrolase of the HAD superfamily